MQVQPKELVKIAYLVGDTTDTNTYFVRATLRDSATGVVISTANLVQDSGNHRRYTGAIQAPADNTGRGRWIDITVGVYVDSGYTTYADNLPEQVFSHVVQERISSALLAAGATSHDMGPAGPDIDYKRIRKMIEDVAKILSTEIKANKVEIPEHAELDQKTFTLDLIGALAAYFDPTHDQLKGMVLGVGKRVADVQDAIPGLVASLPDFGPIFDRFEKLGLSHDAVVKALGPQMLAMVEKLLSKEFDAFTQSAKIAVPRLVRAQVNTPAPTLTKDEKGVDNGEPSAPVRSRKSVRDYHAEARALLRLAPKG